ncbi:MAG: hypothetical protein KTR21_01400 [Rhodobacteraceae bacterium]|nr:hypothetical protein [Paracoccaceae bacterium]
MSSGDSKNPETTEVGQEAQQFGVVQHQSSELQPTSAAPEPALFEEARFQKPTNQSSSDLLGAKKLVFEKIAGQQAQYIGYTSETIRFPINLLLSLNISALIALLLFLKWVDDGGASTRAIDALQTGLGCFAIGGVMILLAAVCNFLLSNHLAAKNREVLAMMLKQDDFDEMVRRYISAPKKQGVSDWHFYVLALTVVSFLFFLIGVASIAGTPIG